MVYLTASRNYLALYLFYKLETMRQEAGVDKDRGIAGL
jgi:hypothetical protein